MHWNQILNKDWLGHPSKFMLPCLNCFIKSILYLAEMAPPTSNIWKIPPKKSNKKPRPTPPKKKKITKKNQKPQTKQLKLFSSFSISFFFFSRREWQPISDKDMCVTAISSAFLCPRICPLCTTHGLGDERPPVASSCWWVPALWFPKPVWPSAALSFA